jgi:Mn2+/Fe2+ NRAMP family transporter
VTFKYELTLDHLIRFNLYVSKSNPKNRRNILITRIIVSLFIPAIIILMNFDSLTDGNWVFFIPLIVIGIILFFLFPLMIRRTITKRVEKLFSRPENSSFTGSVEMTVDQGKIRVEKSGNIQELSTENLIKIVKDNDCYYLFNSEITAHLVPLSSIPDENEFLNLIGKQVV